VHVEESLVDAAVKRVCGVAIRRLRKEGDWAARGVISRAVAGRDRQYVDTALERLVEAGQVESEDFDKATKYRLAKGIE
jgi:DNA-binding transcriptional regulator PaaX